MVKESSLSEKKFRILMISPQPFLEARGTPISVFQRLQGLSALGHEIDLATYHIGADVSIPNVKIHRHLAVPFIRQIPIGPSPAKILLDFLLIFTVLRLLLTRRYDAIHSHEEAGFFGSFFAALFRTPHVYDMHSSLPKQLSNFEFGNNRLAIKIFDILERQVVQSADVILSVGTDLEEHVLSLKPDARHFRIENTLVGDNLISEQVPETGLHRRLKQHPCRLLLYTGTFESYQGLDILLQAIAAVREEHSDLLLCLVGGQTGQVQTWESTAAEMGLSDITFFTGRVPLAVALDYLRLAYILVSPRTEGLSVPLKIYSYLHAGRPILATDIDAHRQVLQHDETAFLTAPTAEALAEGFRQLLSDPELCNRLAHGAHCVASSQYTPEKYVEKLSLAYDIIGKRYEKMAPVAKMAKEQTYPPAPEHSD